MPTRQAVTLIGITAVGWALPGTVIFFFKSWICWFLYTAFLPEHHGAATLCHSFLQGEWKCVASVAGYSDPQGRAGSRPKGRVMLITDTEQSRTAGLHQKENKAAAASTSSFSQ